VNGYNFTEPVRTALGLAREEAVRLHHPYVGTEHELLGLLRAGQGVAATMLVNLNAPLEDIRGRVESLLRRGSRPTGPDLPYTSPAKKVLELSMNEALEAKHAYVGTEHLLLGLRREEKGIAAQVLTSFGLTVDALRDEMHRILGAQTGPHSPAATTPGSGALQAAGMPRSWAEFALRAGRIDYVIAEACKVASRTGAARLTSLHVATGLLAHGEGVAIAALERMRCDVPRLAADLEAMLPPPDPGAPSDVIPVAPDFAQLIGAAQREQHAWVARVMGTHHLLLALLETCPDVARPFNAQGVTPERLRTEARRAMG
jgi:ATP-dependent Clp protease ATP-binding subunit ClpA